MGLLCLPAFMFKLLTRRGRHQVWWTCGTVAPATSIAAGAILGNEQQVGELLRAPNIAVLLAGLWSVLGCACCILFWYAVKTEKPDPVVMRRHGVVATLVGSGMIVIWLLAPVHDYAYSSFRAVPLSWQLVAYAVLFQIYMIGSQVYAIATASKLLSSPQNHDPGLRDPAVRIAVVLNLPAAAFAILGQVLYLIRLLFQTPTSMAATGLVAAADLFILGSMALYAAAGLIALAGPRVAAEFRNRRLVASLDPLWRRLRTLYPNIALAEEHLSHRPALRAGRMLIEIGDGLALLRVAGDHPDPVEVVAHALVEPESAPRGGSAAQALPTPATTREEAQLFLAVSAAYVGLGTGAGAAKRSHERAKVAL